MNTTTSTSTEHPNINPQEQTFEDFASIVLTIDHLAHTRHEGGHKVHKFVCSTQSLIKSVVALLDYYDMAHLLREESTLALIAEATMAEREGHAPIFVLHTPMNTEVITSAITWGALITRDGGSMLRATEGLIDMVGKSIADQIAAFGAASTVNLLVLGVLEEPGTHPTSEGPFPEQAKEPEPIL